MILAAGHVLALGAGALVLGCISFMHARPEQHRHVDAAPAGMAAAGYGGSDSAMTEAGVKDLPEALEEARWPFWRRWIGN
jgi:hypothetical protein